MNNEKRTNWGVGICHYTGKLVNRGFYLQNYNKYFYNEESLVRFLREHVDNDYSSTDNDILNKWYDKDCSGIGYYYSEWQVEDAKYIEIDGYTYEVTIHQSIRTAI